MELLEYMRSQNDMTQAEWERSFEEEVREILVLLAGGGGAGKRKGFWDVSHYFIAYVDCQTGALHTGGGRIVYPVSDEEHDAGGVLDRFRREGVYRLKARKKIPHEVPEGVTASLQNQFLIVEVLEEDPPCSALEEVLAEYRRPVVVTDEVLGELTLDKDLDTFAPHVSSPNSRASGASPPTRRSPKLRKRASLAGSSCAASRWTPTVHFQPTSTMTTCSSDTASPRTEL